LARLRESQRMEASAKPAGSACRWCEGADWRWNGFEWYPDRPHVCMTPEAVADRSERETRAHRRGLRRSFTRLLR